MALGLKRLGFGFFFVFLILSSIVSAEEGALGHLLDPFRGLDLETLYDDHAQAIDLTLYLVIFVGIAQVTLGRRFPGRGGKALVAGFGIALAISLSISEKALGLNLKSFGPLAAAIFVLLLGVILYRFIHQIGMRRKGAGAIAFVIVYFSLRAVAPRAFHWMEERVPFIHGLMSIAILASLWMGTVSLWPQGGTGSLARTLEAGQGKSALGAFPSQRKFQKRENRIQNQLAQITRKERKGARGIQKGLREIRKIIDDYGGIPESFPAIAEKLREIAPKERALEMRLQRLKALSGRLERFDLREFQELYARYQKLPKKGQALLKKELKLQKRKILDEKKLKNLEAETFHHENNLRFFLEGAVKALLRRNPNEAKSSLDAAIHSAGETMRLFHQMEKMERELLRLTQMGQKT